MIKNLTEIHSSTDLFFSLGRLAAISSLLCILIVVLIVIFLLFYWQQPVLGLEETELVSESEQFSDQSRLIKLNSIFKYSSTQSNADQCEVLNKKSAINAVQHDANER